MIKKISDKRKVKMDAYRDMKKKKKEFMIERKYYKCIFCGSQLDPEDDENIGFHHLTGRDNELLTEWDNIEPAHNACHSDFHHRSVEQLLKTKWYSHFCERLKSHSTNNRFKREAYNTELRRQQKAEVIDHEMYLKMYLTEERNKDGKHR